MFERERRYAAVGCKRSYQYARESWDRLSGGTDPSAVDDALAGVENPTVCFFCYGNICRSPFAERYFETLVGDGVTAVSTGVYGERGRPSPETAVTTASEFGVDLAPHRSQRADRSTLAAADLVLLMDYQNHLDLRVRYPTLRTPVAMLGSLEAGGPTSISDPFDGDGEEFRATYERIATAVDDLAERVERAQCDGSRE